MCLLGDLEQVAEVISLPAHSRQAAVHDAIGPNATDAKRNAESRWLESLERATALPVRVQTMKVLAETMIKLVHLEREVYSLDSINDTEDDQGAMAALQEVLHTIDGKGTGLPRNAE